MTKVYHSIVFMHDYEDDEGRVSAFLDGSNGSLDVAEIISYLSQWDYGEESEYDPLDNPPWGANDWTERQGDYVLSWNYGLAYVSLTRIEESE